MKTIHLTTKKELDTYMNPQRQRLIREMRLAGEPVTPKDLSVRLGISPSSVQHHLQRLIDLGVVELHHTRQINGITARYYMATLCTVSLGLRSNTEVSPDDKMLIAQNLVDNVQQGFADVMGKRRTIAESCEEQESAGDILSGVVYLSPGEGRELMQLVRAYLQKREVKQPGEQAWEYALVAYNADAETEKIE